MTPDSDSAQHALDVQRLNLERYKLELDHRKFVLGSVFAAIVIAAIPPSFQLATAALEYVKGQRDQQMKQEEFYETYVKDFLANALNQDIELRIRLAEYFKFVSVDKFRQGWVDYHRELLDHRTRIRDEINQLEAEWQKTAQAEKAQQDGPEARRLVRELGWIYGEVGYAALNRSVAVDPRAPVRDPGAAAGSRSGANFSSLIPGGFFSDNPDAAGVPRSVRTNNPAALNLTPWQTSRPGFVGITPDDGKGNRSVIYRTPEHGVASWYYLLRNTYGFEPGRRFTVAELVQRYAGAGASTFTVDNYSKEFEHFLPPNTTDFDVADDAQMLTLAKAIFKMEAGVPTPLSDDQILFGIRGERAHTLPP
jgi:hypothetical protein